MNKDSIDDVKLKSIEYFKDKNKEVDKARDLKLIEDNNHPSYWSEEAWQTKYFNENPQEWMKLEMFKDEIIRKYEQASKEVDGYELL